MWTTNPSANVCKNRDRALLNMLEVFQSPEAELHQHIHEEKNVRSPAAQGWKKDRVS
jgi:hypothetical protein